MPLQRTVRRGWPVVRFNALPVINAPTQCRRLVCNIGGTAEVREAVQKSGANILAVRFFKGGVLAFGADADIRKRPLTHTASLNSTFTHSTLSVKGMNLRNEDS